MKDSLFISGEWGLNNYLETKQITTFDRSKPWGWYLKD